MDRILAGACVTIGVLAVAGMTFFGFCLAYAIYLDIQEWRWKRYVRALKRELNDE